MSQYRSSQPDVGGTGYRGPTAQRWDAERFANEASRYEERDVRISTGAGRGRGDDDFFDDRRGGGSRYDDDMVRERDTFREEINIPIRSRKPSMQMEREREEIHERQYYKSPSPPPMRRGSARPGMLRRQSSLDTFDRRPTFPKYVERDEYGPPALRRDFRRDPIDTVPLPTSRRIGPPGGSRYVEKEYERVEVDGPERTYYPPQPERVREREIIRTRRRSRSRSSRSSSSSSSSSSADSRTTRSTNKTNKPKRGRTRMPAKLVSKRAIIELGYPFEEEGQVIIIQRALGREHIDEVIQLSEKYKSSEGSSKAKRSSPRESSEKIIEEKRTETFYQTETQQAPPPMMQPMPPPPMMQPMPIPAQPVMAPTLQPVYQTPQPVYQSTPAPEIIEVAPPMMQPVYGGPPPGGEMVQTQEITRIEQTEGFHGGRHRARSMGPTPHHMEYYETAGPVAMYNAPHAAHYHDSMYHSGAMIRRDIHAAAAEAEALRAERRAQKELRRADRIRYAGDARASDGTLAVYEADAAGPVVEVRRSRKGPNPKAIRMMMKTLT